VLEKTQRSKEPKKQSGKKFSYRGGLARAAESGNVQGFASTRFSVKLRGANDAG
jgi:hypothetical protein